MALAGLSRCDVVFLRARAPTVRIGIAPTAQHTKLAVFVSRARFAGCARVIEVDWPDATIDTGNLEAAQVRLERRRDTVLTGAILVTEQNRCQAAFPTLVAQPDAASARIHANRT